MPAANDHAKPSSPSIATLRAAWEAARDANKLSPSTENKAAVLVAWAAYDAAGPPMKRSGYGSRAGKRQAAEGRAMYQAAAVAAWGRK